MAPALHLCCGGFPMIIVDESNLDFFGNLMTSLQGRGLECGSFAAVSDSFSSIDEKIYISSEAKGYDFKTDKNLISFLKSNGFKKAALFIFDCDVFEVEKHLNGAITIMKVPAITEATKQEATFFNHYFIEQVAHNLPNLPCSDDNSIQLTSLIRKISTTDATVLVNGPTGTGKEVISNLIHHFSHREMKLL